MSLISVGELLRVVAVRKGRAPAVASRPGSMSLLEAAAIAGTLGRPSKLPGFSYGIDATLCKTGSTMVGVPGSICAGCYALKDFYRSWRPAALGRERRQSSLEDPRWVDAMVRQIAHHCVGEHRWFRWHDSGDLQSADHLERIAAVCDRTPDVRHWLPTREYAMVLEVRRRRPLPGNLVVRLSALMVDSEPPRALPGLVVPLHARTIPRELWDLPTSTVHTAQNPVEGRKSIACRAIEVRHNTCGPCRACWDPRVGNVSYPQH
jgi:hypothetical protein